MRASIVAIVVAAMLPCVAEGAPPRPQKTITGVFSDLRFIPQAGDVVGSEIFLLSNGSGYFVLLQCAAGRLGSPELLPANVDYPVLTFIVPENSNSSCPPGEFKGMISKRGLHGRIKGLEWPGYLDRKRSYWQ